MLYEEYRVPWGERTWITTNGNERQKENFQCSRSVFHTRTAERSGPWRYLPSGTLGTYSNIGRVLMKLYETRFSASTIP